MTTVLLAEKIAELLFYVFLGFLFVKIGLFKKDAANVISTIVLYMLNPFVIISAFQIDATPQLWKSIGIGLVLSFIVLLIFIVISKVYEKFFDAMPEESTSIVYTNCGNLMLPILIMFYGEFGPVYVLPFTIVFNIFVWTHGVRVFNPNEKFNLLKQLTNVNIVSVFVGAIIALLGVKIPPMPLGMMRTMGDMLGPMAMIMVGIVMGYLKMDQIKTYKRMPLVLVMRLLVCPAVIYLLYVATDIIHRLPSCRDVLMVILLTAAAPAANIVAQFAVRFDKNAEYGSAINVLSTILCIFTMPIWMYLFELL